MQEKTEESDKRIGEEKGSDDELTRERFAGQLGIRKLHGKVQWDGNLNQSRLDRLS